MCDAASMSEPTCLWRGKRFEAVFCADYPAGMEARGFQLQHRVPTLSRRRKEGRGRIDFYIDASDDEHCIIELKATDWDAIERRRVRSNVLRHARQMHRYLDGLDPSPPWRWQGSVGLVYPKRPQDDSKTRLIEDIAVELGEVAVFWFEDFASSDEARRFLEEEF